MKTHKQYLVEILMIQKIESTLSRDLIGILWGGFLNDKTIQSQYDFNLNLPTLKRIIDFVSDNILFEEKAEDLIKLPLGKYAEQLVATFFNHSIQHHLLGNNIQLISQNKTIGEVDFLLENQKTKTNIHLEFAIKFYLKTTENGAVEYLGPNAKDSLARKLKKMHEHQLQLLQKHQQLLPLGFQKIIFHPKLLMKVYSFFPFEEWKKRDKNFATEGWWLKFKDWESLVEVASYFQFINDKKQWIFPYSSQNKMQDIPESKVYLNKFFSKDRNYVMVIRWDTNKKIVDRGFIVRNEWPKI